MYESFYNLAVMPFSNTPDSRFFFETDQHREALAKLEYTVRNKRGFALVTGEIGAGKTTLTRTLIHRLGSDAKTAVINNTRVTDLEMLKLICTELGIELPAGADKSNIVTRLQRFCESMSIQDRRVVIIIDEGQCLSIEAFEEIRLLTNLESESEKLVQLLILGQPELREKLTHPRLAPLTQRIVMYTHLKPLGFDDMTRYIAFRLVRASKGRPNVDFSRNALQAIYHRSDGTPRIVNLICDNALLVGYANNTRFIDSKIVSRAVTEMLPNFHGEDTGQFMGDPSLADDFTIGKQEESDGRRLQGHEPFKTGTWPRETN